MQNLVRITFSCAAARSEPVKASGLVSEAQESRFREGRSRCVCVTESSLDRFVAENTFPAREER